MSKQSDIRKTCHQILCKTASFPQMHVRAPDTAVSRADAHDQHAESA